MTEIMASLEGRSTSGVIRDSRDPAGFRCAEWLYGQAISFFSPQHDAREFSLPQSSVRFVSFTCFAWCAHRANNYIFGPRPIAIRFSNSFQVFFLRLIPVTVPRNTFFLNPHAKTTAGPEKRNPIGIPNTVRVSQTSFAKTHCSKSNPETGILSRGRIPTLGFPRISGCRQPQRLGASRLGQVPPGVFK